MVEINLRALVLRCDRKGGTLSLESQKIGQTENQDWEAHMKKNNLKYHQDLVKDSPYYTYK